MFDETLALYTKDLTLLYVEDDPVSQLMIKTLMQGQFKRVLQAQNGSEGLLVYFKERPSIILTDLAMPGMDGISMLREIRKSDPKTPVLLMTASLDHMELTEAINLGVSKFVAKPLSVDLLKRSLLSVAREIAVERLAQQAHMQEIELLRFRDRYHSRQQEMAQRKERQISRNELQGLFLSSSGKYGCTVEVLHKPKDIMSGDSYSLRHLTDGRPLIFMADAMGCGLSASVTSMLATSFLNHQLDGCSCGPFTLEQTVKRSVINIQRNLLDDEVFSCLFALPEADGSHLGLASFGLPPILLLRNGAVERVRGDNPPLTAFSPPPRFTMIPLEGVTDLLFLTDGMMDAQAGDNPYRDQLDEDFAKTCGVTDLWERFVAACPEGDDDDCTMVRLQRCGPAQNRSLLEISCDPSLTGIGHLQQEATAFLAANGVEESDRDQLELVLGELLMNAFEHGCLELGTDKQQRIMDGSYDGLINAVDEKPGRLIWLRGSTEQRGKNILVWFDLEDPGKGYPSNRPDSADAVNAPCGRGLKMTSKVVDLMVRNSRGNRVVVRKSVNRE